jgi:hypothetical protein
MNLCTYVSKEGGDGEGADSETPSLLSYTLRYVSLTELDNVFQVGHAIDKKLLSTINKILIDKFSIRSFCY